MSYLFDTDVLSNPLKKAPSLPLLRRLAVVPAEEQFTSTITVAEMTYGALRSARAEEFLHRLERDVWPNVGIVPFDEDAARAYARLRLAVERQGRPVSEPDLRIAAIAIAHGLVLATGNVRHYAHIPGLAIEDWLS